MCCLEISFLNVKWESQINYKVLENVCMMISNLSKMEKKREHIYNTTETKRDGRTISCEKNKKTDSCCCFSLAFTLFQHQGLFQ